MTPAALVRIFERFKKSSGIEGVAFGPKEAAGSTANNPFAVAFFVKQKLPLQGAGRYLSDGRARLPKFIEIQGTNVATDVVVAGAETSGAGRGRSTGPIIRAG